MLIPDWRNIWKFWSVRLNAIGCAVAGYLMMVPDSALSMWAIMPHEFKSSIPPHWMPMIGVAVAALGTVARVIKQRKLHENDL